MWDIAEIINGYAQGYFLMADDDHHIRWYRSVERTLMPLDSRFRYPTSLRRVLNQNRFQVKIDRAFKQVVEGCADRETTWISDELKDLYWQLHKTGWAHSFETWQDDQLAGGILGIVIRGVFIGESMFFNIPEGSKVALVKLVQHLRHRNFAIFDAQLMNPHLERFGAYVVNADDYDDLLRLAIERDCKFL
jgi:leucyl/phenylalanyl-tRNA---protein transferase